MSQTIAELYTKINEIVGKEYVLPKTSNKGRPGQFLEDLLGIPHTSNCLDASDGEVKTVPIKMLKNGTYVPKETIAVTMLSTDELRECHFKSSKCCKKMSKMLVVPYLRTGDIIVFMKPKIVDKDSEEYSSVYSAIEADYDEIRKNYVENGILQSKTGSLLQNRTKGAGHGSVSRAFYLRPQFVKDCIELNS